MKKVHFIFLAIVAMACTVLVACSAEDGETGPQGPQGIPGIDGQDGLDGTDGQDGIDGQDGNANVIFSNWLDADWNVQDDPRAKSMNILITEIDNIELRNKTLVFVYLQQWGTSSIYPMPNAGRWSNTLYSYTFGNNGITLNGITVTLVSTNGVDLTEFQYSGSRGNRFRYVLIPESAQSGKLDYSNYEAVRAFYNLPD
ncbi:hypothetical protein [Flagellimonas sp.]|uniref:hypothetical protein n=1 Tax=Flagellimonas sp. TaxID=2058762 RepID=UPI003B515539